VRSQLCIHDLADHQPSLMLGGIEEVLEKAERLKKG